MTPHASAAHWQHRRTKRWSRGLRITCMVFMGTLGVVVVAQYLAGYLFLWWIKAEPGEASPLTIARYSYYYGYRPDVRERLIICSAVGFALAGVAGAIAVAPKRRSLHGNARFASRREIARAGLFAERGIFLGR